MLKTYSTTTSANKKDCIQTTIGIVGVKWSILIIKEMTSSPKRFCELEHSIPNITPRILSKRLSELENYKIIKLDYNNGRPVYSLTSKGHDLYPIIEQMIRWGQKYLTTN